MQIETLSQYFKGNITAEQLVSEISDEVREHEKISEKKGASATVYISGNGPVKVTSKDILILCEAFSNKEMEEAFVNYVANVILLSEEFKIQNDTIEQSLV